MANDFRHDVHRTMVKGLMNTLMALQVVVLVALMVSACASPPFPWVTVYGEPADKRAVQKAQKYCQWDKSVDRYITQLDGEVVWQNGRPDDEFEKLYNDLHYCMFTRGFTTKNTMQQLIPIMVEMAAQRINQTTPVTISEDVRLDDVSSQMYELNLTHTLVEDAVEDIDIERFVELYRSIVLSTVCEAKQSKHLLNNGVVFNYFYYDRNGKFVTGLKVASTDCL